MAWICCNAYHSWRHNQRVPLWYQSQKGTLPQGGRRAMTLSQKKRELQKIGRCYNIYIVVSLASCSLYSSLYSASRWSVFDLCTSCAMYTSMLW